MHANTLMPTESSYVCCSFVYLAQRLTLIFLLILHTADFVVIHNGIITNYKDIKTYLVSCLGLF